MSSRQAETVTLGGPETIQVEIVGEGMVGD
jgi:hypothetical protein